MKFSRSLLAALLVAFSALCSQAASDESGLVDCRWKVGLRSNILYDLLGVPNAGAEITVSPSISVKAGVMYAWWSSRSRNRFWRVYGIDVGAQWRFGAQRRNLFSGHHAGVYLLGLGYDFEFGGKGEMAGKPGRNLWLRMQWGAGVEYGYTLPVGRRFSFDFALGIGYLGGTYHTYRPADGCYVWESTRRRNYWGPTKAEVSLIWLIGADNFNRKGGKR